MATKKTTTEPSYFDTHCDWIDTDGHMREAFSRMDIEERHSAARGLLERLPRLGEAFYKAFDLLIADIDDEQLAQAPGKRARKLATALLAKVARS